MVLCDLIRLIIFIVINGNYYHPKAAKNPELSPPNKQQTLKTLDVCFGEDQSRARTGYAAENLATLRRLALNFLRRETTKKRGIKGKQRNAAWDQAYLLRLLGIPDPAATQNNASSNQTSPHSP